MTGTATGHVERYFQPHVVIVGAGFAGLRAARALAGTQAKVTVIDRRNHHVFQPLLYQVATAGLSPAEIAKPIRGILGAQENVEVLLSDVTGIDVAGKHVLTDRGPVGYDFLILAAGARHSYFNHPEWEALAPGLKSIEDATHIRRRVLLAFENAEMEKDPVKKAQWLTFVLVGAGPTGVEMAGSIAELAQKVLATDFKHIRPEAARILLVEAGKRVLASFPEDLASKTQAYLQRIGVEVRAGSPVEKITEEGVYIGGHLIPARTVIWTAGVKASPLGGMLGAPTDSAGRVKVSSDLSVPGHPEIFVIGDAAHLEQDGKLLPGVAPVAMQMGTYVGHLLKKRISKRGSAVPPEAFRYFDKGNLATIGRSFAIADFGRIRLAGWFAWFAWLLIHIYFLIGFQNRLLVLVRWTWSYFTFSRGARLITERP